MLKDDDESATPAKPNRSMLLVHLAGSRRGAADTVEEGDAWIGTASACEIHFAARREPRVAPYHARLTPRGRSLQIHAHDGNRVRVNGEAVDELVLAPGDVVQIGAEGPVLRFRVYEGVPSPYKTPAEAIADCLANARHCSETPIGRVGAFVGAMPGELQRTRPLFRAGMAGAMLLVVGAIGALGYRTFLLEQQMEQREKRLEVLSRLVAETRSETVDLEAISKLREQIEGTRRRVEDLAERRDASREVIARAADSVLFVQGSYRFVHEESGKKLRFAIDDSGEPITGPKGTPRVALGGPGRLVRKRFTGTAFLVDESGLLLTNRHVAQPWRFDPKARKLTERGLAVRRGRFIGYLPGREEPVELAIVEAAATADVAVVAAQGELGEMPPLPLAVKPVEPGEEVILLGFPAGLQALMARAEPAVVRRIRSAGDPGFWGVTRRLAEAGVIEPLATRGIVGQVAGNRVVYDAETAGGGSGGPLLNDQGHVVAVNRAVVGDFGGSNLGVAADTARAVLERARGRK